jgi:hypothetical protein
MDRETASGFERWLRERVDALKASLDDPDESLVEFAVTRLAALRDFVLAEGRIGSKTRSYRTATAMTDSPR